MNPGTALPEWLASILPQWFNDHAPFTEALWAGWVGLWKSLVTMGYALWVAYIVVTPEVDQNLGSFILFAKACWFAIVAPLIWTGVNGKNAATKSAAAGPQNGH